MSDVAVFPVPRFCRFSGERRDCSNARRIVVAPSYSKAFRAHVERFCRDIRGRFAGRPAVCESAAEGEAVLLRIDAQSKSLPPQGYELLTTAHGARLSAGDEAGAFYGLQTFRQILEQTGPLLPVMEIRDRPDFTTRGVMLDISRCKVPSMETLELIVDMLASVKINHLQLYTEHTFAYSAHETVWRDASPMTAEQIRALDAYCRERYVDLAPNQNSFGHFERWLCHASYKRFAECPEGFTAPWGTRFDSGSILKPDKASLELLDGLYSELLPNFTCSDFNVGCDETWELGQGASRRACDERGTTRVYLDFLLEIQRLVRKHGRRMMFWGDIILREPALVKELPADITALEWGYEADHAFDKRSVHFAESGIPFYVCPGTSSWNAITGRTTNCFGNLLNAARSGLKHGAAGYLITDWGDGGHHQYLPVSYAGFLAGAAYAWACEANQDVNVAEAIDRLVVGDTAGVIGSLLTELGDVHLMTGVKQCNRTVFDSLLFGSNEYVAKTAESIGPAALGRCDGELKALSRRLSGAELSGSYGTVTIREIENTIAMARCAVRRAQTMLGGNPSSSELCDELRRIIGTHEDLWLARNRPGGLPESSGRLRRVLDLVSGDSDAAATLGFFAEAS